MKDFAGNELEAGMRVLICVPGYKHLVWATVKSLSPKMSICSYVPHWKSTEESASRYPNQVVLPMTPELQDFVQAENLRANLTN